MGLYYRNVYELYVTSLYCTSSFTVFSGIICGFFVAVFKEDLLQVYCTLRTGVDRNKTYRLAIFRVHYGIFELLERSRQTANSVVYCSSESSSDSARQKHRVNRNRRSLCSLSNSIKHANAKLSLRVRNARVVLTTLNGS